MKVLSKILISVLFLAFFAALSATTNSEGVLLVPMTTIAPEIDGELDNVWYSVTKTPMLVWVDDIEPDEDWIDCYTSFYFMYDVDAMYFFGDVWDNSIETDSPNDYENDSFEIYFDSENLKNDTYVADNDYQWRWVYGLEHTAAGCPGGTEEIAWIETDYGVAFELAIPTGELPFDFEAGHEFGFEVQYNERDAATRQTMSKWWGNSNDSWLNPQTFGNAMLVANLAGDPLIVPYMDTPPEVDGEKEDAWDAINTVSMAVFVDEGSLDLNALDGPNDIRGDFKVAYDADAIYFLGMVVDDEINTSSPNDYENDSFEIYFDCENLKNDTYVADNDYQWRWVYGLGHTAAGCPGGTEELAWIETDDGYQLELTIPTGELPMDFEAGHEFGFEVQVNERDGETRENMIKWWNNSNDSWLNPQTFGTAVFGEAESGIEDGIAVAEQFQLSQNYPNPFNPTTEIAYSVDAMTNVNLTVYDVMGHEVSTLVNEVQAPNDYRVTFDATGLTSGVYFYKLETGSNVITKKMILMK